jgi:hypothetical protein
MGAWLPALLGVFAGIMIVVITAFIAAKWGFTGDYAPAPLRSTRPRWWVPCASPSA